MPWLAHIQRKWTFPVIVLDPVHPMSQCSSQRIFHVNALPIHHTPLILIILRFRTLKCHFKRKPFWHDDEVKASVRWRLQTLNLSFFPVVIDQVVSLGHWWLCEEIEGLSIILCSSVMHPLIMLIEHSSYSVTLYALTGSLCLYTKVLCNFKALYYVWVVRMLFSLLPVNINHCETVARTLLWPILYTIYMYCCVVTVCMSQCAETLSFSNFSRFCHYFKLWIWRTLLHLRYYFWKEKCY